jgi:hypothetical protein
MLTLSGQGQRSDRVGHGPATQDTGELGVQVQRRRRLSTGDQRVHLERDDREVTAG